MEEEVGGIYPPACNTPWILFCLKSTALMRWLALFCVSACYRAASARDLLPRPAIYRLFPRLTASTSDNRLITGPFHILSLFQSQLFGCYKRWAGSSHSNPVPIRSHLVFVRSLPFGFSWDSGGWGVLDGDGILNSLNSGYFFFLSLSLIKKKKKKNSAGNWTEQDPACHSSAT